MLTSLLAEYNVGYVNIMAIMFWEKLYATVFAAKSLKIFYVYHIWQLSR